MDLKQQVQIGELTSNVRGDPSAVDSSAAGAEGRGCTFALSSILDVFDSSGLNPRGAREGWAGSAGCSGAGVDVGVSGGETALGWGATGGGGGGTSTGSGGGGGASTAAGGAGGCSGAGFTGAGGGGGGITGAVGGDARATAGGPCERTSMLLKAS